MNIIFMGNPEFSIPSLEILNQSQHTIQAVVTNPPKPKGRGQKLHPTPIEHKAAELNLPIIHAGDLTNQELLTTLSDFSPDAFAVVAFRILPESLIEIPKMGAINLHTSLLPKYRGAAPIQRAIMNGDSETGVTTFRIQKKVDTGDILLQETIPILPEDNFGSLSEKLMYTGANLFLRTFDELEKGTITGVPQDNALATPAKKIHYEDCKIQWDQPSTVIHNKIRGLSPRPCAFTFLEGKRLKVFSSRPIDDSIEHAIPGEIIHLDDARCVIQTGSGTLEILECQKEGKSRMQVAQFLRGNVLKIGDRFGDV